MNWKIGYYTCNCRCINLVLDLPEDTEFYVTVNFDCLPFFTINLFF